MYVLKFGGTSMGDETTWRQILKIISGYQNPVIVVSATARTTRQLVAAGKQALNEPEKAHAIAENIRDRHITLVRNFLSHYTGSSNHDTQRQCTSWIDQHIHKLHELITHVNTKKQLTPAVQDAIASIGEQLSAYLFARCGQAAGLATRWVDAKEIIKTDDSFGRAIPDRSKIKQTIHKVSELVCHDVIPVMGGFYGSTEDGHITTLGFEGSDYTASLIGAELSADAIEIWTDVSGIYTCDPRIVKDARPIPELSYQEATELAYFGAKVLHPSTMKPAASARIPITVKNIFEPRQAGTTIHQQPNDHRWATAMTHAGGIVLLTVTAHHRQVGHQFLAAVFGILSRAKVSVKAVTTTEASVSVALKKNDMNPKIHALLEEIGDVDIQPNQGLVSLIGCAFDSLQTIENRVFEGISGFIPHMISYSRSKRNLNIALEETDVIPAVCHIHNALFSADKYVRSKSKN